ncbi:putative mfs sugar transporter protein [Phaeoacremonium minimum UCRPA7]|uniref:Putative mfs sugar transporter protein n=1 Tax=Phaeoacremonium minimum (strain UCR-PA7) TaxID=1286976 RepID=R8BVR3_PHAM7|nr:putative mfs sugar transporter protein [Phaeoacremonium minimum UCRPA7]EOO03405.1 putative mfs sugar transporter protein [Phaeoacremonium minimum UCRPA7]
MEGKRLPKYLLASVLISNGGLLNGLDTGSIGAITNMAQFAESIGELSPFLLGFTVSLIMLTGSVPSIMAGHLADKFGRLKTILLGAILFGIGVILQGAAGTLAQFLVGRAVAGLGEGVYLTNVSVYITEIAPAKSRGMLAGMPQFMATAGVCVGYFICYGTVHIQSSMAWRLPYVIQGGLALAFGASCLILPESPRWLMLHGKRDEAIHALQQLNVSMTEAETGFLTATEQRPMGKIYASEIQPSHTRGTANSVASGLSFFTNWLVAILTPILLDKSAFGAYFLFGGLALGTVLVLAAYMPETRGRSLENIQEAFHQPKLKSVGHYVRQLVPAMRHRSNAAAGSSGEAIELDQGHRETLSTASSVDAAARGLRVDMVTA